MPIVISLLVAVLVSGSAFGLAAPKTEIVPLKAAENPKTPKTSKAKDSDKTSAAKRKATAKPNASKVAAAGE